MRLNPKFLLFVLLLSCLDIIAQDGGEVKLQKEHRPQLSFGMQLGVPRDSFARIYNRDAMFGIGGRLLFPLHQEVPVDLGFQFYYMWMGTEKETFRFNAPQIGDYEVNSKVHGSMMPFHANLRLRPLRNVTQTIDPYIEGLGGFRIFHISTEVQVDDLTPTEQPDPKKSHIGNWAWSYGFAMGTGIRIAENIKLELRYAKLWGGEAKYIDTDNIRFDEEGNPKYSRKKSETNLSNYELGIIFVL